MELGPLTELCQEPEHGKLKCRLTRVPETSLGVVNDGPTLLTSGAT